MKVLVVNTSDKQGGAARASYRLYKSLLGENVDCKMLVLDKCSDDYNVYSTIPNNSKKLYTQLISLLNRIPVGRYKNKTKTLFSIDKYSSTNIDKYIDEIKPDILHLHWINHGMLKVKDLSHLKIPIIWSMHDNWLFTGGCHIKWECNKYIEECGACPRLGSQKDNDLSRKFWIQKKKNFQQINNLTIIGLSKWMAKSAKESSLLKNYNIVNLPNPIDTKSYFQFNKQIARSLWGFPTYKKLVLFGAMSATSDINKGFKELSEAITAIDRTDLEFVVFGSSEPENPPNLGCHIHYVGSLSDDVSLVALYNSVDVMVVPSLQENLSNAIMESLACGTPVVAFDIGGNSDMVEHKSNGYLAKPYNTDDLALGINWVLDSENYTKLSDNAVSKVENEFSFDIVSKKYIDLYKSILNK